MSTCSAVLAKLLKLQLQLCLDHLCYLAAVRLLMPGELSKHAVTEGTKAVTKATKEPPNMQA